MICLDRFCVLILFKILLITSNICIEFWTLWYLVTVLTQFSKVYLFENRDEQVLISSHYFDFWPGSRTLCQPMSRAGARSRKVITKKPQLFSLLYTISRKHILCICRASDFGVIFDDLAQVLSSGWVGCLMFGRWI